MLLYWYSVPRNKLTISVQNANDKTLSPKTPVLQNDAEKAQTQNTKVSGISYIGITYAKELRS